jgi:BrxA
MSTSRPTKNIPQHTNIYNGDIVAGSLLIQETRKIASLLLNNVDDKEWEIAIEIDNILQKRSPASAIRQAKLIKNRLTLMTPELWRLIKEGNSDIVVQAILAASIKHSRLLGDFMDKTLRERWLTFNYKISAKDWNDYLETCVQIDPKVSEWKNSTISKLRQVVFRILAEAKYIDSTRTLKLLPVSIVPELRHYLTKNSEDYVLKCMEVTQ